MKNKNFLILGLAAILPALTSCSSEDSVSGESDRALTKVAVSATINLGDSRVELSDNGIGKGLKESWSTTDAFVIQDANTLTASPTVVTKTTSNEGETTSTFTGDLYVGANDVLYGYYPSTLSLTSGSAQALVNYASQGGTLAKVQKQAIMTATTTYTTSAVTDFPFSNATAILRVRVNLPVTEATQVTKLTISGTGLYNKKYITLASGGSSWTNATLGNQVVIPNATNSTDNGMTDANGELTMYVAVIPQTLSSGFTVTAQTPNGNTYTYTLGAATFAKSNVQTVNSANAEWTAGSSAVNATTGTVWDGKYYMWDDTEGKTYVSGSTTYDGSKTNSSPLTDEINVAQKGCTNCPTYKQICMYLGAGVYLDSYTTWTGAPTTHYGIWLKKACYINGFAEGTATPATAYTYDDAHKITSTNYSTHSDVLNSGEYFFLPCAGYYYKGSLSYSGTSVNYWSSTPSDSNTTAWSMNGNVGSISVGANSRSDFGLCLWTVQ